MLVCLKLQVLTITFSVFGKYCWKEVKCFYHQVVEGIVVGVARGVSWNNASVGLNILPCRLFCLF